MTGIGWLQILLYFLAALLLTKLMGVFLYRVFIALIPLALRGVK